MDRRWMTLLAAVLLIGGALLPGVAVADQHEDEREEPDDADEGDEETREDDAEEDDREESRRIEVESDEEGLTIELKREDSSGEDEVEMGFDMEDATFELKYEEQAGATERERSLEATFQALAEYRDTNDNSKYDLGEPIISAWSLGEEGEDAEGLEDDGTDLSQATWDRPTVQQITVDGQDGREITVNAALAENGTFGLRFLVFGDFVDLESGTLEPTSAKIDILVDRYPYQAEDTALTLFMETKSEQSLEQEDDEDGQGVSATTSLDTKDVTLRFTWLDHASVDGSDQPVGTTLFKEEFEMEREEGEVENETKREFALSYARGDTVIHDPKASVHIESASAAATPGAPTALVIVAVGLVAVIGAMGRRDR